MKWSKFNKLKLHELPLDEDGVPEWDLSFGSDHIKSYIYDEGLPPKERKFLVSDGFKIWLVYINHCELWFADDYSENEYAICDRLTHWAYIDDIPLP